MRCQEPFGRHFSSRIQVMNDAVRALKRRRHAHIRLPVWYAFVQKTKNSPAVSAVPIATVAKWICPPATLPFASKYTLPVALS